MTNITEAHRHAFEALTSGKYQNFALFSCFSNMSMKNRKDYNELILRIFIDCKSRDRRIVNTLATRRVDHEHGIVRRRMRQSACDGQADSSTISPRCHN